MWLFVSWLFLLVTCSSCASFEEKREDGVLYEHLSQAVRVWSSPILMRSYDFPNPSPEILVQTWRFLTMDPELSAIKVVCNRIYIPKAPGSNECGDYRMTLREDEEITKEFCGEYGPFVYISKTKDIKYELHTDSRGGAVVDCTAQSILITQDRIEITTTTPTTTTTPKPTRPAYLNMESEEVDSSEDGGEDGNKRTSCACGWANKATTRIVNGTVTARNEFPFMVTLTYRGARGNFCGATIITRYHALTATHCTVGYTASELSIVANIHNKDTEWDSPEYPIERIINHDGYSTDYNRHDISLLVVEKEIQFNQFVGPACLPQPIPALQLDRQYVKILGWGRTSHFGESSTFLRKVNVRMVPLNECHYMFYGVDPTRPTQICTYAKQKSACFGDSGGPVIWLDPETNRYTHIGIASFVMRCADNYPTVHTRVQAYLDWIHNKIRESRKPDSNTCTKID